MKKIIVPTDFSAAADNAARYAVEIAAHLGAGVTLMHALPLPVPVSEIPVPMESYGRVKAEADELLLQLKNRLEKEPHRAVPIDCYATNNSFFDETKRLNEQEDVYAVVMGTTGANATAAFFLGSYSLTALKNLTIPLIVVPPAYKYNPIQKVALACDMEDVAATIPLKSIQELLKHYEVSVDIIYVSDHGEGISSEAIRESAFVKMYLADFKPSVQMLAGFDIQMELENYVAKNNIDLLLLLPKERGFAGRIFHKSLSKKMVMHPAVPMMMLHR